MPVEQAVLDFHPVEEFMADGRRMLRILLVAAARDMVMSALDAVRARATVGEISDVWRGVWGVYRPS